MTVLLIASMVVMLISSRNAVKDEAVNKAVQTLEGINIRIDNILLSVEQTTGNIFFSMLPHLDDADMMATYSRKLVETNPYVAGCAIAFKENYFKGHKRFMAYIHHADSAGHAYGSSKLVDDDMFGSSPYTEQVWYTKPLETGRAGWLNPMNGLKEGEEAPIITYSLPIWKAPTPTSPFNEWETIGVIGVDVSLSLLTAIVTESKPSDNSFCTLMDSSGLFLVHPDEELLLSKTALKSKEETVKEIVLAMTSGKSGYSPLRVDGTDCFVFYKPFQRITIPGIPVDTLSWSTGIVYPKDDIYDEYNRLTNYAFVIAVVILAALYLLCRRYTHSQLKPLRMLSEQAQHIADGHYHETIPASNRPDEIGLLQDNFRQMQHSLASTIGELEQLTEQLQQHGDNLRTAYNQAQKADRMKTAFLHNMSNQMIAPAESIAKSVDYLCDSSHPKDKETANQHVDSIQHDGETIAELLKDLLNLSDDEQGKEVGHA